MSETPQDVTEAIDDIGWRMIDDLQRDGRMAFSELGRRLKLSPPAVADRVKRLQDLGVFKTFKAIVDPARLGAPLQAFVRLRAEPHFYGRIEAMAEERAEVMECHRVVGDDSFILKIRVRDLQHLERMIERLNKLGVTNTSLVLSSPLTDKIVGPAPRA